MLRLFVTVLLLSVVSGPIAAGATSVRLASDAIDPLLVSSGELGLPDNTRAQDVFLYRYAGGEWQAIPFQIDFRKDDGSFEAVELADVGNPEETPLPVDISTRQP